MRNSITEIQTNITTTENHCKSQNTDLISKITGFQDPATSMCNTWGFHIFKDHFHEACESKGWNNNSIWERNPSPFEILFCFLVHSNYKEKGKRAFILHQPQLPDAEELPNTTKS